MRTCPEHPDTDTMVPCLGCGRYFCRICDPPSGAGQYCPSCYEESLARISEKKVPAAPSRGRLKSLFGGREKPARAVDGAGEGEGKRPQPRFAVPVRKRYDIARSRSRQAGKRSFQSIKSFPGRVYALAAAAVREHQPFALVDREAREGMPPLAASWIKLSIFVLSGAVAWTVLVAASHRRSPLFAVAVALVVSAGVTWALGTRFSVTVGITAVALVVFSLAVGELFVQLLSRYDLLKLKDLAGVSASSLDSPGAFYSRYFQKLILNRMLPSAVVAFIIGWWPFPKRLSWRGFMGGVRS